MRIIAVLAGIGALVGVAAAGAVYWFGPSDRWVSISGPRRYVDYLGVGPSPPDAARLLLLTTGGGVVAGLVVGAALALAGVRLTRVSGPSPTG